MYNETKKVETVRELNVSCFKNGMFVKDATFEKIVVAVKDGYFDKEICQLRESIAKGDEAWKTLKKELMSFTPSATFNQIRQPQYLINYNQLIVVDIDKVAVNVEGTTQLMDAVNNDEYTYASFISPSGMGIKIFAKVSSGSEGHENAFNQLSDYYGRMLGIGAEKIDRSGKDINRLCFISSDERAYINEEAKVFEVKQEKDYVEELPLKRKQIVRKVNFSNIDTQFQKVVRLTNNIMLFVEGNRNNFINLLSNHCNRWGIDEDDAVRLIADSEFCYDKKEVIKTIHSAYKNVHQHNLYPYKIKFAEDADFSTFQVCSFAEGDEGHLDYEYNPFIPQSVYDNLPSILKDGTDSFKEKRQKDILLTGALGVLSGCFPTISGEYKDDRHYPNLYSFISAPPASGKGALKYAKYYGTEFHKELLEKSCVDNSKSKKLLFIPANASNSALMSHLQENKGIGIFFESEADSLSNALKNDWANFSDLLRKAFHHETVSLTRKGNYEYIEIEEPKLSVVLSGTPKQVQSLTNSIEDGLFSRFLFYSFKSNIVWENVSPSKERKGSLTEHFKKVGRATNEIINKYLPYESVKFNLTENQWDYLNWVMDGTMTYVTSSLGDDAASLIKRMGLMWFRIAMILTAIRDSEEYDGTRTLICSDIDFEIADQLMMTYKDHILSVYKSMSPSKFVRKDEEKLTLYNALPGKFKRKDAVEIGEKMKINYPKVDRFLSQLLAEHKLDNKYEYGIYSKVTM